MVTIPRKTIPAAGFPLAAFIRTGGGGDRPLVDRGEVAKAGSPPVTSGAGPALYFARAGFAGVSVDGPHGGLRNPSKSDEQYLIFNIVNPVALRDNVRQSALEYILLARVFDGLKLKVQDCPGARTSTGGAEVRFDPSRLALMGHSMGATIAPLVLAYEPRYKAALLSGAGASWIENIVYKRKPIAVQPIAKIMLGYGSRDLTPHDPVLTLVQWAIESADPQVYAHRVVNEPRNNERPRHILMMQGIIDNYILPRIANALSLSLGLDLAGPAKDSGLPGLTGQTPLAGLLPLVGRTAIPLPASGNRASGGQSATAVVVQHPEDGVLDGHEVVFQSDLPKAQYRCFLQSFAAGKPVVIATATAQCKPWAWTMGYPLSRRGVPPRYETSSPVHYNHAARRCDQGMER